MEIKAKKYSQGEAIKFMRQATGLTQKQFSESIGKKASWARDIEQGLSNLYYKDFIEISKKHNFEITIEKK